MPNSIYEFLERFKASETLLGIETLSKGLSPVLQLAGASKPLKPF